MTIDNDKIRELLTELIDCTVEERVHRLEEIRQESPELYQELESLLPYTEGDRDDIGNDPFLGTVVGHFTVQSKIGSGGMGRVYLATQENPQRQVAFKILRRGLLSRSASKRFEIECRLLGRLHHGGIAQVYEAGVYMLHGDRVPWIAMELIKDAEPLTTYAQKNNLDTNEKLTLFMQVCEAVSEAHRHGIIHRDLKPANILVDSRGNPKIIDFGVAKAIDPMGLPTALHTNSTDFVGTMQYMSPEQASGENVDVSSDVYSLGVMLYELLSGEKPYDLQSTTIPRAIETLTHVVPKPLRTVNKKVSRDLEIITAKAMAQNPRNRYRSANDLCDDIHRVLVGEPISARKEFALSRFLRRKRRTAAAIVIALPLLAISTGVSFYFSLQAQRELRQKEKLIEFAKEALATRDEIIVTNPEYWQTHYDLSLQHARQFAGDDKELLADMYGMLASVADTGNIDVSLRIKTAELLGKETEQGALLLIQQCAYEGRQEPEKRIQNIIRLFNSIPDPSNEFIANSLVALADLELHSEDQSIRDRGRSHSKEALRIAKDEMDNEIEIVYSVKRRIGWSNIFRESERHFLEEVIELIDEDLINRCEASFGRHDPKSLSLYNMLGIAYEELGDYDKAIEILRPAAKVATESYGVGHNFTWRYLNNLAISLAMKAKSDDVQEDESAILKNQAISLWNECIRQSIMHGDDGATKWYGDTFRDHLPKLAPSKEEIETWSNLIQFNGDPISQNFDFRSALVDTH